MKMAWGLSLIVLALTACASLDPVTDADRTIVTVIETPGLKANQIYDGTKMWIAENFHSAKAVIEYDDKASGTLIGNGSMKYPCDGLDCLSKGNWSVRFTMRIEVKDDKFRATFTNVGLSWPPTIGPPASAAYDGPVNTKGDMDAIKPKLFALADSLGKNLQAQPSKNW